MQGGDKKQEFTSEFMAPGITQEMQRDVWSIRGGSR